MSMQVEFSVPESTASQAHLLNHLLVPGEVMTPQQPPFRPVVLSSLRLTSFMPPVLDRSPLPEATKILGDFTAERLRIVSAWVGIGRVRPISLPWFRFV